MLSSAVQFKFRLNLGEYQVEIVKKSFYIFYVTRSCQKKSEILTYAYVIHES